MPLAGHDLKPYKKNAKKHTISTPMPLAGHDLSSGCAFLTKSNFYSHAPRGA